MNWIEHRIREAADKQLTELDLSGNFFGETSSDSLTELPSEVLKLKHLRKLDLSRQYLRELPSGLGQLASLTDLDLSDNPACRVAAGLAGLTQLVRLTLPECKDLVAVDFVRLPRLEKLDLGPNHIIRRLALPWITELTITCYDLGWLKELTTLRKLALGSAWTRGTLALYRFSVNVTAGAGC